MFSHLDNLNTLPLRCSEERQFTSGRTTEREEVSGKTQLWQNTFLRLTATATATTSVYKNGAQFYFVISRKDSCSEAAS